MSDTNHKDLICTLFGKYLLRAPSDKEIAAHSIWINQNGASAFARLIAYCDESARLDLPPGNHHSVLIPVENPPNDRQDPGRVAIQISGHFRNWERTFPLLLEKLILPLNADIYLHTWNTRGNKVLTGSIAPTPDQAKVDVEAGISALKSVRAYEVDDCSDFLAKDPNNASYLLYGIMYRGKIGGSAEPKYINSQLYGIHRANALREQAEIAGSFAYDTVIKIRADYSPSSGLPAREWRPDDGTIWVPGQCANHAHPSCRWCRQSSHEGPHGSDVCDVFAVGSSKTMSHYCSVWSAAPELYGRLQIENAAMAAAEPNRKFMMHQSWRTVNIWGTGGHKYHCYYPERLLREHLQGYRLLPSGLSGQITRS